MNHGRIRNPKNVKQEIKLKLFYVLDLVIVVGMLMLANYLSQLLYVKQSYSIVLYIVFGLFGIFICIKPPGSPTNRNFMVLLHMFQRDKNKYVPIVKKVVGSSRDES